MKLGCTNKNWWFSSNRHEPETDMNQLMVGSNNLGLPGWAGNSRSMYIMQPKSSWHCWIWKQQPLTKIRHPFQKKHVQVMSKSFPLLIAECFAKSGHAQLLHFPTALHQLRQQLLFPQPKRRGLCLAGRRSLHLAAASAAGAGRGAIVAVWQAIGSWRRLNFQRIWAMDTWWSMEFLDFLGISP